jgi:flagellar biosynthesis/type III secretory pathway M-ring protein FliF/YscJ
MLWADLAALIGAGAAAVAAVVAALTYARAGELHRKVDEVHVLVNERLDTALERISQLGAALTSAGVDVPDTPEGPGSPVAP